MTNITKNYEFAIYAGKLLRRLLPCVSRKILIVSRRL